MLIKDKDDWLSSQESDTSEVNQSLADLMRNSKKRKIGSSTTSTIRRKKEQNSVLVKRREKFTFSSLTRDNTSDTEIEVEPNRPGTSSGTNSKCKRLLISKINALIRKGNTVSKNDAATGDGGTRHMWGVDTTEDSDSDLAPENEVVKPFGSMSLVPQATRVDDIQREKIRKGMYVDFRGLVPHPKGKVAPTRCTIYNGLFKEVVDSEDLNIYS